MKTRKQIEDAYNVFRRIIELAEAVDKHDILAAKTVVAVQPFVAALSWVLERDFSKEGAFDAMVVSMREEIVKLSAIIER